MLSGIDLQTGEAIPLVRERHTSKEYIEFLKLLDSKYPKEDKLDEINPNEEVRVERLSLEKLS